jgi:hypothetical protein
MEMAVRSMETAETAMETDGDGSGGTCDILAQGLIGLIGYSYQQVATSFLGTQSKGTLG